MKKQTVHAWLSTHRMTCQYSSHDSKSSDESYNEYEFHKKSGQV